MPAPCGRPTGARTSNYYSVAASNDETPGALLQMNSPMMITDLNSRITRFPPRHLARISLMPAVALMVISCGGETGGLVGPLPVTQVSVVGATTTFEIGESVQFTAVPRSANGNPVAGANVSWSVSPQSIASVNATGLVTARAAGTATVTASVGSVAGGIGVTISDAGIPLTTTVSMPGNAFSPFNVTIRRTGTVMFDFPSEQHDVTFQAKAGAPANIPVTRSAVISRVFNVSGVFGYDCLVHPGMSGQVTVVQ